MKRISVLVLLVIFIIPVHAQEFLSKYENLSPKDLKSFVDDWYSWSCETHPDVAAKTAIDTVLCKTFEKLYSNSSRKQKYFVFPDRITVWYHKEPFKYLSQTTDILPISPISPPPGVLCHDIYYTLDHKELILPPYRTGKKALYLTKDIGQALIDFIDKYDESGNGRATKLLNRYFKTGRNGQIRTEPEIIQINVYPNAYVIPFVRDFFGGSMLYSLDFEYIRDVDNWIE